MIKKLRMRLSKRGIATSMLLLSGLCGFAAVAISQENASSIMPIENSGEEVSNGAPITLDNGLSITPIAGWKIERKSLGMGLVMKEVLPQQSQSVDYSKPTFAKNITLTTLPEARPIDQIAIEEIKTEISKMFARDPSLRDFTFTDQKLFDYKGKNDGIVLFSQLTVNNFQMMQMQIVVSGEKKSYLMTYSDLAANFANPAAYDAAWKSMTSLTVPGVGPKRFEKEMLIGGTLAGSLLALILPFMFARWVSSRRIRKLADELQYDWDHGSMKTDADYELSDISSLGATTAAKQLGVGKRAVGSSYQSDIKSNFDRDFVTSSTSRSLDSFSTRHSRFV